MKNDVKKAQICVGRDDEQEKLKKKIDKHIRRISYESENGYVINLHGRGGIGKTVLTNELYQHYREHFKTNDINNKVVYVNASGCFDIPELLFRLRMEMDDKEFDFEKFDTLYELFYDASRFLQYKYMKKLENAATSEDNTARGYTITKQMDENSGKLSELLMEPLVKAVASMWYQSGKIHLPQFLIQSADIAGPILDRIQIRELISTITQVVEDKKKNSRYIEILKKLKGLRGTFSQEQQLITFFVEALEGNENAIPRRVFLLFIDNFQNPDFSNDGFVFRNREAFLGMFGKFPALWFISSRDALPHQEEYYYMELKGLDVEAAKEIIKATPGTEYLGSENEKEIVERILKVSGDEEEDIRYNPIILAVLCQVLEKEIESVHKRAPDEAKHNISPELFANIKNQSALTYYFEMGKSPIDLECFHVLSCADLWDEYTFSVLRNKLQLYLLNTKHILAKDSMTEIVDKHSIKLHDEIAKALRESVNNRIRYDVYSIMSDAFLEIQESSPIMDDRILRNFFGFTKAYCNHILNGVYDYLDINAFDIYTSYYNAFLKSVEKADVRISKSLIEIYLAVVREYKDIAIECNTDNFGPICDAYHGLGVVVYNSGDSKKAEEIDKEYLEFVEKVEDTFGLASALNALAYDLSANHLYSVSYKHGKKSLDVALNGICITAEKMENESAKKLYELYKQYFMLPDGNQDITNYSENVEEIIKKGCSILKKIHDIPEDDNANIIRKLWEQMLKTRGNIPWYFIEDSSTRNKNARYAMHYGKVTYLLRKYYYGEDNSSTITSYHNTGAYLLKYAEYCLNGKIVDAVLDLKKAFSLANEIFSTAFKKRKEILKKEKDVVAKEEYLQKLEDEFSDFFDIYGKKDIEQCYEEKMSECNREALESLQYQSYACYMLATIQDDENKKKEWLQKAIRISDKVIIARSIVLGSCHRKTLESMRYGAEYYHQDCQRNEAEKRIRYVLKYLDDKQVSENQVEDYKELFEKVTGEAEGNV